MQCQSKLLCCLSAHQAAVVLRVFEAPCSLRSLACWPPAFNKLGGSAGHVCRSGAEQLMECWPCWLTAEARVMWRKLWCTCSRAQQAKVRHNVPAACIQEWHAQLAVSSLFGPAANSALAEASHQLCCLCRAVLSGRQHLRASTGSARCTDPAS